MRRVSCDLLTHFAPSSPAPALSGLASRRGQGARAEPREPAKPELRGSQSLYSVSWFDWIPRLENANCHIGFLDFPILKHEQMLSSAQLSSSLLLPCLYTQLNTPTTLVTISLIMPDLSTSTGFSPDGDKLASYDDIAIHRRR